MRHQGISRSGAALALIGLIFAGVAAAADRYDQAVAHTGRPAEDLKRDVTDHPAAVLRLAGIKRGMRVADVLAGDGYYSELASYLVGPSGKVLLINNKEFDGWSDGLAPRLAGNRLANVEHQTVDVEHMGLPDKSLDAVLLIKVYHDLYWVDDKGQWPKIDPGAVLTQLSRALKPGGTLLLVDHSAKPGTGSADATPLHRIDEQFAIKDFEAHGFKVAEESNALRRPDDPRDQITYKGPMLGKTDRFMVLFRKST